MSRHLVQVLVAAVVLKSAAVASTMLWPSTATSTASQVSTASADFDHVFASVTTPPVRNPVDLTTPDFDKVFASVSAPRRENTPPNRERLRNIGWQRILGSS